MVDVLETVQGLTRSFQERLTARTAYGEPITANGVTVIPVAKVGFGFGGGGGGGTGVDPGKSNGDAFANMESAVRTGSGGGGGGGGGGAVQPIGFIEISDMGARWVPVEPSRSEMALRALTLVAVAGGARGGFFRRLLLVVAGQAIVGAMTRPRLGPLPDSIPWRRSEAGA